MPPGTAFSDITHLRPIVDEQWAKLLTSSQGKKGLAAGDPLSMRMLGSIDCTPMLESGCESVVMAGPDRPHSTAYC